MEFAFADRAGFQALSYEEEELRRLSHDIRGIRRYTVSGMPKWGRGGGEWHRIRQEFVGVNEGSVSWVCEDLFGNKRQFDLKAKGDSIWMPPFILHTYTVHEEGSELWVFANTIFPPDDPSAHDTYSLEAFQELQAEFARAPK